MAVHNITAFLHDKRGRVLSVGKNSYEDSNRIQRFHAKKVGQPHKVYVHAEIAAIAKCKDLSKAHTLKIFRYHKDGTPALAAPCKVCQSAIEAAGIKIVEYTR
jgi:deoxycytidylate deaminase